MNQQSDGMQQRRPGIFISHAHEDRAFVRRLGQELVAVGIPVWIDDMQLNIGDEILESIINGISSMDYLGVVISRHTERSDWVRREIQIALKHEEAGRSVKILPLLLRGGELPDNLAGRTYADFTSEPKYRGSLARLLARFGIAHEASESPDRLTSLTSSNRLLGAILDDLRTKGGVSIAAGSALLDAEIDDFEISEFFSLVSRKVEGPANFSLALTIVPFLDHRAVGHEALDRCLEHLDRSQLQSVVSSMEELTSEPAVVWCHRTIASVIKDDIAYSSFLHRHVRMILDGCRDEMLAYLLHPDRGPGNANIRSFETVLEHCDNPRSIERRWSEWILSGRFESAGSRSAREHYQILGRRSGEPRFANIAETTHEYVRGLLDTHDPGRFGRGLYHLVAMIDAGYRGVDAVQHHARSAGRVVDFEIRTLRYEIAIAIDALIEFNRDRGNAEHRAVVQERLSRIRRSDTTGIIGYWTPR